jgi:hypothetical protein
MRMGFSDQNSSYLRGAAAALRVEVMATIVDIGGLGIGGSKEVDFKELCVQMLPDFLQKIQNSAHAVFSNKAFSIHQLPALALHPYSILLK